MKSIRKWFCKPKRSDQQLLAQFYFANEELNEVSQELDSFDGRQDPERCTALVNHLRRCQDKVLAIVGQIMVEAIPNARANRDYRAKFPEDVLLDSLPGQLWFGAECLGAGSTIMNREIESAALRPLARGLTKTLDTMRMILKEQCYDNLNEYSDKVKDILKKFDETFAEFELSYVSTMVPVKSTREYDTQQDVIVLFCETLNRALEERLLTQDQVDDYDPGLMFTIPRLAIVCGLVVFPEGPLNVEKKTYEVSELFRPFQALLHKIKELLQTLSEEELHLLEKALCSSDGSWEDIEQQLKLMGKGPKVRCNAAVQTDPLEMSSTEKKNKDDADGNFLMFGMSPVEEVKGHVESEVNILGTSPDETINQGRNGQSSLPSAHAGETFEDGTESNSSGIEEDNHREDNGISSPSEKSPGDLSNGDIFDDVDSHTLGMSATEQKVQYSVSPKHRSIVLKKPLLDRINSIGHDTMSHVYGMSPVEPNRPGFDRHSPIFGMSPLDSPILDSYAVTQARSDVLGMSPVDSVPMVSCKVTPDLEVEKTGDKCHCEFERMGTHARSEDHSNILKCNHCDLGDPVGSGDSNYNKKTVKKPPETNFNQSVDGVNYVETILKEKKGAENHTDSTNQGEDSRSVQSRDKSAIFKLCQELVDDIVSYAVQYSAFTSQHLGGRCLTGLKLSSDNHDVSPICQSCAKDSNAKDKPDELYCRQCKPKERSGSPLYQEGTTKSSETKVVEDEFVDPLKQVVGDLKPRPTTIGNVSVLSLEHTKDNHDDGNGQNGSVAKQLESKCTCAIAPSSDNNTKCSSCLRASPEVLTGAGDAQMANATKAPPSDNSTIRCSKCLSPLTNSTVQDTEIVHSTGAMQTSKAVGGTPESVSWNSDTKEGSWESPIFGKGKPSTELSQVIPQSERLSLHGDASGQSIEASSDNSIAMQNEPGNSRSHSSYQVSSPSSGRVYPASAINRVTGSRGLVPEAALGEDDPGRDRRESNVSIAICSSCGGELVDDDDIYQWESEDSDSDSTSSMSDNDEHEIAIAIQAAELSARQEARSHFSSSWDLVHRLFVCIAGVADQLQTNYASDLRNILKTVFEITANPHKPIEESEMGPSQDVGSSEVLTPSAEEQASTDEDENQPTTSAADIQEGTPVPEFSPEVDDKNPTENQTQIAHNNAQQEDAGTPSVEQAPLENEIKVEGGLGSPVQEGTVVYDNHQEVREEGLDSKSEMQQPKFNDVKHEDISFETIPNKSLNNGQESKETPDSSPVVESHDVQAQLIQQDSASADLQQTETETNLKAVTSRPDEADDKLVNEKLPEVEADDKLVNENLPEVEADDKLVNEYLPEVEADDKLVNENLPEVEADDKLVNENLPEVEADDILVNENLPEDEANDKLVNENLPEVEAGDKLVNENLPEVEADQTKEIIEVEAVNDSEQKDYQQEQSETTVADNQQTTADEQTFSPKYPEIGSDDEASFDRQQTLTADNQHEELLHMKLHQNNNDSQEDVFDILQQEMPAGATAQDLSVAERILEGNTSKGHEMAADHQVESTGSESSPAVKPKKKRHRSGDLLSRRVGQLEEPPLWVPDEECSQCTSCQAVFTMIRRKHHCRNCGKIFCSRCSANCVPLPRFGQEKPVRVCNRCYMFQVTPFQH